MLTPQPFERLVTRMFRELEQNGSIFEIPASRFFTGDTHRDLSVTFHGRRAATPFGPAAGPHTQLAPNIVQAWVTGARILELKTVQVLDTLTIPRPCIDMRTVGFNVEWSQELRLEESLEEYVKASMLIEMLAASGRIRLAPGQEAFLFDMSVGYDLEGIRGEKVQAFLRGMLDAGAIIDRLRRQIPAPWKHLADLDFRTRLSDTLTLSTFHGCPPNEIESIVDHLLEDVGLHCVVKLNPTLLGREEVRRLLTEVMGYHDLHVPDAAFDKDATWPQALAFVERLKLKAERLGLGLGVKLTNTLIVENNRGFFPATEKEMYLSGQPLHVLAMNLVRRFRQQLGGELPLSFSAGIDRQNFPDAVSLGLVPVTVCSDLLRTGGYGRAHGYFRELEQRMDAVGARSIGDFIIRAHGQGEAALERAGGSEAALRALREGGSLLEAAGEGLYARWVREAAVLNTEVYVPSATMDERYSSPRTGRPPKKIGSHLELFDCISCDKCIYVCPNSAIFAYALTPAEIPVVTLHPEGDGWRAEPAGTVSIERDHQIGIFADACNECGNCDVFCPEDGGPYALKPLFFGSLEAWRRDRRDGLFIGPAGGAEEVHGRFGGREYRMSIEGDQIDYTGPGFAIHFRRDDPAGSAGGRAEGAVDLIFFHLMDRVREAIRRGKKVSWVGA